MESPCWQFVFSPDNLSFLSLVYRAAAKGPRRGGRGKVSVCLLNLSTAWKTFEDGSQHPAEPQFPAPAP